MSARGKPGTGLKPFFLQLALYGTFNFCEFDYDQPELFRFGTARPFHHKSRTRARTSQRKSTPGQDVSNNRFNHFNKGSQT